MYARRRGLGLMLSDLISQISAGIARQEGAKPSLNNPGNLRAGPGMVGTDSRGIAIFPDLATGQAALDRQVGLNIDRGLTLEEFFAGKPGVYAGYAPAADSNQPNVYAQNVAGWYGIDPSVPLLSLAGGTPPPSPAPGPFLSPDDGPVFSFSDVTGGADALVIGTVVLAGLALWWFLSGR